MIRQILGAWDVACQAAPVEWFHREYRFRAQDLLPNDDDEDEDDQNPSITVLTYNVNFAGCPASPDPTTTTAESPAARVVDAVVASDADVVVLQETHAGWESLFRRHPLVSETWPHRWYRHPGDEGRAAGGSAFLSKRPILRAWSFEDVPRDVDGSVFVPTAAEIAGSGDASSWFVANVHLRPPVRLDGTAGFATAHETGFVREKETAAVLSSSSSSSSRRERPPRLDLIAGDWNEEDGARACAAAARAGFRDALAEFVPYHRETHRWRKIFLPGITPPVLLRKRLDRVAYRADAVSCDGCGVLTGHEEGASDHQPVLARFRKRTTTTTTTET